MNNESSKKLIAFTLYDGVSPLDMVGSLTVLRKVGPGWAFETATVGERIACLETDTAIQLIPAASFADIRSPFAVFAPGGGSATLAAMHNEPLLAYLRSAARTAEVAGSTGNGALILAAAGLLAGRDAAIHPAYRAQLERTGARFKSESSAKLAQLATEYDPHPPFDYDSSSAQRSYAHVA